MTMHRTTMGAISTAFALVCSMTSAKAFGQTAQLQPFAPSAPVGPLGEAIPSPPATNLTVLPGVTDPSVPPFVAPLPAFPLFPPPPPVSAFPPGLLLPSPYERQEQPELFQQRDGGLNQALAEY